MITLLLDGDKVMERPQARRRLAWVTGAARQVVAVQGTAPEIELRWNDKTLYSGPLAGAVEAKTYMISGHPAELHVQPGDRIEVLW